MLTLSLLSPGVQWYVVPLLGYFSQNTFRHLPLEQGSAKFLCDLPAHHHGNQVYQEAVDRLGDYSPDTADEYRYCPCCVLQKRYKMPQVKKWLKIYSVHLRFINTIYHCFIDH